MPRFVIKRKYFIQALLLSTQTVTVEVHINIKFINVCLLGEDSIKNVIK